MRSPFAYLPRGGPLDEAGAVAATLFLASFALVALVFSNPIVLAATAAAVASAARFSGGTRAMMAALRWGLWLGLVLVVVNVITAQRGDTILVRGFDAPVLGQIDVSAEALAEGAVLALRVLVVLMAFGVQSATVDPDRLLRVLRPVAARFALTATLITRMVPLAASDYARLREGALLRGPAAAPVGRGAMARRLVAGSLDRAVDVAATLELRGYGRGVPRSVTSTRPSRHPVRFLATAVAIVALAVWLRTAVGSGFDAYPTISIAAGLSVCSFALLLPLLAALPFMGLGVRR